MYTSFNKFSLSTVPFTLIGACMDQWSYAEPTNTLDRLNMMPKPKCLWLNKTYIYIADCTQIYLGEIIIIFDDICCSDYWPLSTTFTCSSTFPLLGGGARITYCNKMISSMHELLTVEYSRISSQVPWTAVYIHLGGWRNYMAAMWVHENCSTHAYAITLSSPPTLWCASTCHLI